MSDFHLGVKAAVPTALGYVAIGLAFGVVAAASGLSALEVGLMCALVYGGSAQFAMCALVVAGAGLGELTLTVFLVNLRNMLAHAIGRLRQPHPRRRRARCRLASSWPSVRRRSP